MSEYRSSLREDYNLTVKLKNDSLLCYSPKKMKEVTGNVVGEVLLREPKPPKPPKEGKTPRPEPPSLGLFHLGARQLPTRPTGHHNGFFYKKAGYVWVGGNDYLCVLTDRRPFLILLASLLATFGVVLTILLTQGPPVLTPEHPMPDKDENSLPVVGDEEDEDGTGGGGGGKVESEVGGGFVSMIFTKQAKVDLSEKTIEMYFVNPHQSNHSITLELYVTFMDQNWLVAKSGRVDADYGLKVMKFNEKVSLTPTTENRYYVGKYVVRYYDPETGERSIFTTEIEDVMFTVVE